MTIEFEWDRPIIIIGAGRSGSTLVSATLGEHPDVYAAGETSFLLNRLWEEFFRRPEYVSFYRTWNLIRNTRADWREINSFEFRRGARGGQIPGPSQDVIDAVEATEEARLSQCLGSFMAESLVPPEIRRPFWSFKEIWNGSESFPYGWRRHDLAFPRARYVHIVRHPLTWVQSYFANLGTSPSRNDVIYALKNWVSMVELACLQREHGERYKEFRYEDFKHDCTAAVSTLLSALELEDNARCHRAADFTYLPSKPGPAVPALKDRELSDIAGLEALARQYDYLLQF